MNFNINMATRWVFTIAVLFIGGITVWADPAPTLQPVARASITLTTQSSIDDILDALNAVGTTLKDFTADVRLTDLDRVAGSSSADVGTFIFQLKGPGDGRLRIHFTRKVIDGASKPVDHEYTLDNGHLLERDYKAKTEDDREVAQPGEKMDLMALGKGPFPLPIGQNKNAVKSMFAVTKAAPSTKKKPFDDLPNTVHIILTPLPGTKYARQFNSLDLWVDLVTFMPTKIVQTPYSTDGSAPDFKITELTKWEPNVGLGDKDFQEPEIKGDWDRKKEKYNEH